MVFAWCTSTFAMPSATHEHLDRHGLVHVTPFTSYVRILVTLPDHPEQWPPELQTRQVCPLCAEAMDLDLC